MHMNMPTTIVQPNLCYSTGAKIVNCMFAGDSQRVTGLHNPVLSVPAFETSFGEESAEIAFLK